MADESDPTPVRVVAGLLVDQLYEQDPVLYAGLKVAMGDTGEAAPYNTVDVSGTEMLAGMSWNGGAADLSDPSAGPVPELDNATPFAIMIAAIGLVMRAKISHRAPSVADDESAGYGEGKLWVHGSDVYVLKDATRGAANWLLIGGGGGGGSGTPATTVVAERLLDHAVKVVGVSTNYAREDHSHGTPDMPTASDVGADPAGYADAADAVVLAAVSGSLALKADKATTLTGTAPITVDGDNAAHNLSASRTIAVATATTGAVGVVQLEANSSDTSASHVVTANDTRLSDARAPVGVITGDLAGSTYPALNIASSVITTAARTVLDDTTIAAMFATLGVGRTITATAPIQIAGGASADLSADRTISILDATTAALGSIKLAKHLGGTGLLPTVIGLQETGTPTSLLYGAIGDTQMLVRSGTTVIGADRFTRFVISTANGFSVGYNTITLPTDCRYVSIFVIGSGGGGGGGETGNTTAARRGGGGGGSSGWGFGLWRRRKLPTVVFAFLATGAAAGQPAVAAGQGQISLVEVTNTGFLGTSTPQASSTIIYSGGIAARGNQGSLAGAGGGAGTGPVVGGSQLWRACAEDWNGLAGNAGSGGTQGASPADLAPFASNANNLAGGCGGAGFALGGASPFAGGRHAVFGHLGVDVGGTAPGGAGNPGSFGPGTSADEIVYGYGGTGGGSHNAGTGGAGGAGAAGTGGGGGGAGTVAGGNGGGSPEGLIVIECFG